jgi:5-methylcytosine-specific restriction endonuclease McrA
MPEGRICRCGRLVTGACCQPGTGSRSKRARRRGTGRQRVWDSRAWRRVRLLVLHRDGFTCRRCGWSDGTLTGRGLVADHVIPVEELLALGRDPLDPDECQALCLACSGAKDGRLAARSRRERLAGVKGGGGSYGRRRAGPAPNLPHEFSTTIVAPDANRAA